MKLFDLDVDAERKRYVERGWIHAASGVTDEFLSHLRETVDARIAAGSLTGPGLAGAKEQFLFDFPVEVDLEAELLDPVAAMFGLNRDRLTLSERHLKAYDADADPDPLPHKDRLASTVSLGITIRAPEGTRAFLHPDDQRDENPFMGPHLLASLSDDRHPTTALDPAAATEIADRPGDVLAFPGSSVWHGRRHAAGAVLLYLKFNDFGADPLGEDPRAARRRASSDRLVAAAPDHARVHSGRALVSLSERAIPPRWERITVAEVWDRSPLWLSDTEEHVLRMAAESPTVAEIVEAVGARQPVVAALRRMVEAQVVELTD